MLASLKSGHVQQEIERTRSKRTAALACRKQPLTGMSEFVDLDKRPVPILMPAPPSDQAATACPRSGTASRLSDCARMPINLRPSLASAHRSIWLASARRQAFAARATFAKNFFEAAAYKRSLAKRKARRR